MAELNYDALKAKYKGFDMPILRVFIEEKQIETKRGRDKYISDVRVELTSGYESGIAKLLVYNVFDVQAGCFAFESFEDQLQIGKSVVISAGYDTELAIIFRGYIANLRFVVEQGKAQYVEVTALDVKGQMMAGRYSKQLTGKTYSDCVKEILTATPYAEIIGTEPKISPTPELALNKDGKDLKTIDMVDESDYEFVVKAAKKFGYDFFSDGEILYFRPPKAETSPLIALEYGKGVLFSSMEFSLTGIVKEIEVRSSNIATGESFFKKETISGKYNTKGSDGKKLVNKGRKIYIDPTIDSNDAASKRAKALAEDMKYRFGTLEADCVGIPELKPGRFIEMGGLLRGKNVEFYVASVVHAMNGNTGYTCKLLGKASTLPE